MTHFAFTHEFAADPPAFWKVFFDEPYNVDLYKRLGMKERTMLHRDETDEVIDWEVRLIPSRDLPGFMKKIVGGDFGYVEHSTFYKKKDYIDVRIQPTLLKDRTKIKSTYTVTSLGPGKIRRTYEGDISVNVPLIGRKIESVIIDDMRRSYDMAAVVTAEWLAKK